MNAPINLNEYKTGIKVVDWCIARVKLSDHSDKHGYYVIGEFKGTLPYRMAAELYDLKKSDALKPVETEEYTITFNVHQGQYKSDFCRVQFYITIIQNEDLCPDEE